MKFVSFKTNSADLLVPRTNVLSIQDNLDNSRRCGRTGKARLEIPQIFVLVAMLLMVLLAMHEAGKPENWEWMGFKAQSAQTNSDSASPSQQTAQPFESSSNSVAELKFRAEPSTSKISTTASGAETGAGPQTQTDSIEVDADMNSIKSALGATGGATDNANSKIASQFWRSIMGKMKPQQQSMLLKMLRSMRRAEALKPEIRDSGATLVSIISKNRDRFHQELFDQLALTNDGTEEKKKLSSDLFESQAIWDEKILPAFKATVEGEDFTLDQLQAIHRLQTQIDPVLFDQVQDKTAIGWAGDAGAWNRTWEIVLGDDADTFGPKEPEPNFKPVTRIELMSQPRFYRGKPIKVEGWVRSARIKEVSDDSQLGITHQYVMWVRPKETKQGPYCVYAHALPEGFPELSNRFQDLNEHVHIEGYFFKVRTYVAADSSAITSPVIVASGLTRIAPVEYTSVHSWQPTRSTMLLALLLMPILATAIAWWAFRSSQSTPYQPGQKTASKIDKSLGALATDPNVQTDREKIQALYDSDLYDSDPYDSASDHNEFQDDDSDNENE